MERPRTSAWLAIGIALVFLTPLLYLLSTGPVVWLFERGLIAEGPVMVVFGPIEWLTDKSPRFYTVMEHYIDLWDSQEYVEYRNAPLPAMPVPPAPVSAPGDAGPPVDFGPES